MDGVVTILVDRSEALTGWDQNLVIILGRRGLLLFLRIRITAALH